MQRLMCIGALLLSLAVNALAIQCYSCESVYNTNCGDDFDMEDDFKWDCSHVAPPRYLENDLDIRNATACMKRAYKVSGMQRIERSCFFGDVNDTVIGCQLDPTLDEAEAISCHICDNEDFCNHSNQPQAWPQYLVVIGFALTAKLLIWLS
ncbi:PREDICTED: uncharacterized protein LOC108378379 [Rhagoletis zephyria]|uniref:uncharacterized protein LOC108378379 n=1 Tax=Rhagoletis zephyria TaxID=28612 RepID=UPI000811327B|nr:PREDICTED: uncharacterized protein LOC108378379 [Rhagoletis zephyria]